MKHSRGATSFFFFVLWTERCLFIYLDAPNIRCMLTSNFLSFRELPCTYPTHKVQTSQVGVFSLLLHPSGETVIEQVVVERSWWGQWQEDHAVLLHEFGSCQARVRVCKNRLRMYKSWVRVLSSYYNVIRERLYSRALLLRCLRQLRVKHDFSTHAGRD